MATSLRESTIKTFKVKACLDPRSLKEPTMTRIYSRFSTPRKQTGMMCSLQRTMPTQIWSSSRQVSKLTSLRTLSRPIRHRSLRTSLLTRYSRMMANLSSSKMLDHYLHRGSLQEKLIVQPATRTQGCLPSLVHIHKILISRMELSVLPAIDKDHRARHVKA